MSTNKQKGEQLTRREYKAKENQSPYKSPEGWEYSRKEVYTTTRRFRASIELISRLESTEPGTHLQYQEKD